MKLAKFYSYLLSALTVAVPNLAFTATPGMCEAQSGFVARTVDGEIGGIQAYREDLGNGWTFALLPAAFGWELRVFDRHGFDLTALTPPRFGPNPREIFGWHFRNAENSASNDGSVNAPQHMRSFVIGADVGAVNPAGGTLTILDYGLADLEPGQQARMVYLRFQACLTLPQADETEADQANSAITPEDIEIFGACGLAQPYTLDAYVSPPILEGDFDGDGAFDHVGAIIRAGDQKRAIGICRAGNWLEIVGVEESLGDLSPDYFDEMDYWSVNPKGPVLESYSAEGPVPTPPGDTIIIGIEEASSVLLYWDGAQFQSYWQGD
ncbi:MAG: hypothetical protein R3F50_01020 [Gammaproteobacteria bacterium]